MIYYNKNLIQYVVMATKSIYIFVIAYVYISWMPPSSPLSIYNNLTNWLTKVGGRPSWYLMPTLSVLHMKINKVIDLHNHLHGKVNEIM